MSKKILFSILSFMLFAAVNMAAAKHFTLVIDAGHGGHDTGAMGTISKEKDLTLRYALAFGRIIEKKCPDVKVIYTRKRDTFIKLHERAELANRNKADLFVSVHINAVSGSRSVRGYQTWTLGNGQRTGNKGIRENLEVAKRENSVIYLEKDYRTTYKGFDPNSAESDIMFEFMADKYREQSVEFAKYLQREIVSATGRQNGGAHQNNLAVLRLTSMPSCLMELGFISTPDEEVFMNSDRAVDLYARGFYNAFVTYKNRHDTSQTIPYKIEEVKRNELPQIVPDVYKEKPEPQPQSAPARTEGTESSAPSPAQAAPEIDASRPVFKVQLFASTRRFSQNDKIFRGLTGCECYTDGRLLKYTYGASNNYDEVVRLRKNISTLFPDAFVIAFRQGVRMDVNEAIREYKNQRK